MTWTFTTVDDLVRCCARGEPAALSWFDRHFLGRVDRIAARLGAPPPLAEEVKQQLRCRLLVSDDGPPGITAYRGDGPLDAWLAIAASRLLWRKLRARNKPVDDLAALEEVMAPEDPELECCRHDAAAEVAEVFRAAVQDLELEERQLLSAHALEGRSIDDLAEVTGLHRATVARRLQRIRSRLRDRTRQGLSSRLALSGTEIDSLIRLAIGSHRQPL
jgi:RNA polymerase sigma-70 factor (ECF subfamily)